MCIYETVVMFFRHRKCKACYKQLKNLSNVVKNRAEQVGRHGSTFKELQLLMAPLDYWHTHTHTYTHARRNTPQSPNTKLSQKESTMGKALSSMTERYTYTCVFVCVFISTLWRSIYIGFWWLFSLCINLFYAQVVFLSTVNNKDELSYERDSQKILSGVWTNLLCA